MALARDPQLALLGLSLPEFQPDYFITTPPSSGVSFQTIPPSAMPAASTRETDQVFADERFLAELEDADRPHDEPPALTPAMRLQGMRRVASVPVSDLFASEGRSDRLIEKVFANSSRDEMLATCELEGLESLKSLHVRAGI
jgi:hypothetical protein